LNDLKNRVAGGLSPTGQSPAIDHFSQHWQGDQALTRRAEKGWLGHNYQ